MQQKRGFHKCLLLLEELYLSMALATEAQGAHQPRPEEEEEEEANRLLTGRT